MIHIDEFLEVVGVEFVVLGSIGVGMVVVLGMVDMVVGMVDTGWDHMEVDGGRRLVRVV